MSSQTSRDAYPHDVQPDDVHSASFTGTHTDGDVCARLTNVGVTYDAGSTWAVRHVSLTLHAGEYVALVGPNGSGKSTLARVIAGLLAPDEGTVELLGQTVAADNTVDSHAYRDVRRKIGIVFQNPQDQILTTRTADDVAFGPENLAVPPSELPGRVHQALSYVESADLADSDPRKLSGGQQQRIAIASLLAMQPELLILDEPTAMLDEQSRTAIFSFLDKLHADGTTILLISHNRDAVSHADRIIHLDPPTTQRLSHDHDVHPTAQLTRSAQLGTGSHTLEQNASQSCDIEQNASPTASTPSTPAHHGETVLSARHLSYRFSKEEPLVLRDVSLDLHAGEIVALRGPNGAGKSTLARLLALATPPSQGSICIGDITIRAGQHLPHRQQNQLFRTIGFAMQHPQRQFFAQTVRDEVSFGPHNFWPQMSQEDRNQRVDETLRLFGIENLADRSPFSLSGGQQRLVALADVIVTRPRILIADEPSAGLDAQTIARIHSVFRFLAERGTAILLITHSNKEVKALHARTVFLPSINHIDDERNTAHSTVYETVHNTTHGSVHTTTHTSKEDAKSSFISRTDPRSTLLLIFCAMLLTFALHTPAQLIIALALTGVFLFLTRINLHQLMRVIHPLLAVLAMLAVVNMFIVRTGHVLFRFGVISLTSDGAWAGILYSTRLLLVLLLGAGVTSAFTPTRLADGFVGLLHPFRRFGVHVQEIGIVLSLALRFLPLLMHEADDILVAQRLRGGSIARGSISRRFHSLFALMVPVFAACARHAGTTALALDARCYEEGITRTHLTPLRLSWRDGVMLLLVVSTIVVEIICAQ